MMFWLQDWVRRTVIEGTWPDLSAEARAILVELQRLDAVYWMYERQARDYVASEIRGTDQAVISELLNHPDLPDETKECIRWMQAW